MTRDTPGSDLSREEAANAVRAAILNSAHAAITGGGPAARSRYAIVIPLKGGDALAYHTASQAFARWDAGDLALWDRVGEGATDVSDPALALPRRRLRRRRGGGRARGHRAALPGRPLRPALDDPHRRAHHGLQLRLRLLLPGPRQALQPHEADGDGRARRLPDRKTRTLNRLHIAWYGGEPLMHREGIYALSDRIIPVCRRNKCSYTAFIVTNGYFLDLATAQALLARGVSSCQVTLDGSAEQHDQRRYLLSGKPTYERICANLIEVASHTPLSISIRVNVDSTNGPDVVALLDDLKARGLAGRPNFGVYFAPVEAITEACASCDAESFAKTDYGALEAELYRAAFERGLCGLPQPPVFHGNCGAVQKNGLVLTPAGDLHKCWDTVQTPALRIGSIFDVEEAEASPRSQAWLAWSPFKNEVCRECPILPTCAGACAFKFVHPDQTHGEGGSLPCPSWKFNMAERLFLRAEKMGFVQSDEWDPVLGPTRADAALKTGLRHSFEVHAHRRPGRGPRRGMTTMAGLRATPITARLACALERRTFPRYRTLLPLAGIDPAVMAFGLFDGRDAIGLLLGRAQAGAAALLSVSVAESRRRQGGGSALVRAFEAAAAMRGLRRAETRYTVERGATAPVAGLLRRLGWSPPRLQASIYVMERDASLAAPWFTRAQERLHRCTIQSWASLGPDALKLIGPALWVRDELHPRHHAGVGADGAAQDLDASAVLRDGPEPGAAVTGWVIVHRTAPGEARVTASAVRPDRERGFAYGALIAHANRTLYDAGIERASFVVRPYETRHTLFAERRIAPLVRHIRDSWDCTRLLAAPGSPAQIH